MTFVFSCLTLDIIIMRTPRFDIQVDHGALITQEREKASFDVEAMAVLMAGSGDKDTGLLQSKARIAEIIMKDATLQKLRDYEPFESLTERVENGLIKSRRVKDFFQENPWLR